MYFEQCSEFACVLSLPRFSQASDRQGTLGLWRVPGGGDPTFMWQGLLFKFFKICFFFNAFHSWKDSSVFFLLFLSHQNPMEKKQFFKSPDIDEGTRLQRS